MLNINDLPHDFFTFIMIVGVIFQFHRKRIFDKVMQSLNNGTGLDDC